MNYHEIRKGEGSGYFLLLVVGKGEGGELYEGIVGSLCGRLGVKCWMLLRSYVNYVKIAKMINLP